MNQEFKDIIMIVSVQLEFIIGITFSLCIFVHSTTFSRNLLLVTHRRKNSSEFYNLILKYPTRRQFIHLSEAPAVSTLHLVKILADSRNASFSVSEDNIVPRHQTGAYFYSVNNPDFSKHSLGNLIKSNTGSLAIYPVYASGYQFLLCENVRKLHESILLTHLLLQTADVFTWIAFVTMLLCLSLGIAAKVGGKLNSLVFLLSPMLNQPLQVCPISLRYFLSVWMIGCWILRTSLEAELTSILTSPRPIEEIKNIRGLLNDTRQLLYPHNAVHKHHQQIVSNKLWQTLEIRNRSDKPSMLEEKISELEAFEQMLDSAAINPHISHALVTQRKFAHLGYSVFEKREFAETHRLLMSLSSINKYFQRVRCYLGPSNMLPDTAFVAVTGIDSGQYMRAFHRIAAGGIFEYWYFANNLKRIQDSGRFKNGELRKEQPLTLSLGLEDRIQNVFVGWSILFCISGLVFIGEICSKEIKKLVLYVIMLQYLAWKQAIQVQ